MSSIQLHTMVCSLHHLHWVKSLQSHLSIAMIFASPKPHALANKPPPSLPWLVIHHRICEQLELRGTTNTIRGPLDPVVWLGGSPPQVVAMALEDGVQHQIRRPRPWPLPAVTTVKIGSVTSPDLKHSPCFLMETSILAPLMVPARC